MKKFRFNLKMCDLPYGGTIFFGKLNYRWAVIYFNIFKINFICPKFYVIFMHLS